MMGRGTSTPHPHVLRVMGPHTLRFINHEESTSQKESVDCQLGLVEVQLDQLEVG